MFFILYDILEEDHTDEWFEEEKTKFKELDVNNDGILENHEILNWASPNNE